MNLVTRAAWGAVPASPALVPISGPIKGVAIHHGASPTPSDHGQCAGIVRSYQHLHMVTNGWSDIAYNHLVCPHGFVFVGRGFGKRSAAQGTNDGNDSYHAVCYIGTGNNVPAVALTAFREIIHAYQTRYPQGMEVRPHSDFHSTSCPGDGLRAWVKAGGWRLPVHKLVGFDVAWNGTDGERKHAKLGLGKVVKSSTVLAWLRNHPRAALRGRVTVTRRFS